MTTKLPSIGTLIGSSWRTYTSSWKLYIWLIILPILLTLAAVVVVGVVIATVLGVSGGQLTPDRWPWLVPPALVGVVLLVIINALGKIAFIKAIEMNGQVGTKELIRLGWPLVGRYVLLGILLGLVILLGFVLLVIPGFIFSIWFMFAPYVLISEGMGGKKALSQSRMYVKGKFWGILGRMLVLVLIIGAITGAAAAINQQGVEIAIQLISTFILAPVATIYSYKLYQAAKVSSSQ